MSKKKQYKPYPYQEECLQKIMEAREAGETRALVVMASGLGKTLTAAFEVERFFAEQKFGRVLILCHSEEILDQTKKQFKLYFGEEKSYGMFTSSHKTSDEVRFLFATFQTMKTHRKEFQPDEFSHIIVDEAHHSYATTYFPTIRYFKPKFLLGLTATPDRLDGQDITDIYGEPVYELGFVEANNRGLMTKCEYRMMLDDLLKDEMEGYLKGEEKLSIGQLNRTLFAPKRDEEIVRIIRREMAKINNPKTMIFCRSIPHARKIAKLLGDDTALVYNGQGDIANTLALEAFRDGKLQAIVSVQKLNEGIDVPDANMVVFLRNTVSPTIFYQQLGRGTRLAEGKGRTVVLDFVANCERIKMILQLKKEIEGFRTRKPLEEPVTTKAGDEKPNFTLDIATPEFETKMVDIVELIERASRGREWTKEEIIAALQRLAKELGRTPTKRNLEERDDVPSIFIINKYFGSFNNALIQAGLAVVRWTNLSREEMIQIVMAKSVDGIMPLRKVFDEDLMTPHSSTIMQALGVETWAECANILGLKILHHGKRLSENQQEDISLHFLRLYYDESVQAEHWLTGSEMISNPRLRSPDYYIANFGSMCNVRNKAFELFCESEEEKAILTQDGKFINCKQTGGFSSIRVSEQYIIDGMIRLTKELRRRPTWAEIDACNYLPSRTYVQKMVGNLAKMDEICHFDEILELIGVEVKNKPRRRKPQKTRDERAVLIQLPDGSFGLKEDRKEAMRDFVRRKGRRMWCRDLSGKNGLPGYSVFRRHDLTIDDVNRMIGTDEILAELAAEEKRKQEGN